MKIDVEGHEHKVVLGGRQLLASHDRCSMMIELFEASAQQCGNSVIDTVNVLKGCGFAVFVISAPGRLTPYTEVHEGQLMDGKLRHPNLFFLKPSVENRLRAQRILQ